RRDARVRRRDAVGGTRCCGRKRNPNCGVSAAASCGRFSLVPGIGSGEIMSDREAQGDFDDDDGPWASPEIRENYEIELGRFLLEFNQIENLLGTIIETRQ